MLRKNPALATTCDGRGDLALHHAARNGDVAIMKLLIDGGADVNAKTGDQTVLYCAGGHGHVAAVRLLLNLAVDVDAKLHGGRTFLEWAAQFVDQNAGIREAAEAVREHVDGQSS